MRVMVYSHDGFGLGNIRRMLAICNYLLNATPELSILLLSGSPVAHSFRMPQRLDYIKLPCIGRSESGQLSVKYLGTTTEDVLKLRSDLIKTAAINFKPDLLLVDKKPYALKGELKDTLKYLKIARPKIKAVLLLRDILDNPKATIEEWRSNYYYEGVELFYDRLLVVGMPEVFDLVKEYQFPDSIAQNIHYCGYIRREPGRKPRRVLRQELQVQPDEQLVLVTPGGGGDGYHLVDTYLRSLVHISPRQNIKSLIVCGPEMPLSQRQALSKIAQQYPKVQISEFTDDLMSYMEAADTVVSMGGYNTICEILSCSKPAIIVPRVKPVQEQWIRAERMNRLGLFKTIHPKNLTPESLIGGVFQQLSSNKRHLPSVSRLDLDALPRITYHLRQLLFDNIQNSEARGNYSGAAWRGNQLAWKNLGWSFASSQDSTVWWK